MSLSGSTRKTMVAIRNSINLVTCLSPASDQLGMSSLSIQYGDISVQSISMDHPIGNVVQGKSTSGYIFHVLSIIYYYGALSQVDIFGGAYGSSEKFRRRIKWCGLL